MKHYCKKPALLALLILTCNIGFAYIIPWQFSIDSPTRLPQIKTSLFEVALAHAEQTLIDIGLNKRPSDEQLENALKFHNILQQATFLLLSEDLQKTGMRLKEQTHNLDPKVIKCAHALASYQYEYFAIQSLKFITAAALYYANYSAEGILAALLPPWLFSTRSLQEITTCETLWEKEGFATSDAHSISMEIQELMQTSFFSAALLNMKYNDLANLPWETSTTWGAREWKEVETIFEKIHTLLTTLHKQLLGNPTESLYAERLQEIGA